MDTRFTSCLFATVVMHAYERKRAMYHHLFLAVTVLSLLFHCTRIPWIGHIDWFVAHLSFAIVTCDMLADGTPTLLVWPLLVALCWMLGAPQTLLHAVAVAGLHTWLWHSSSSSFSCSSLSDDASSSLSDDDA
jgi:hypothetical protein